MKNITGKMMIIMISITVFIICGKEVRGEEITDRNTVYEVRDMAGKQVKKGTDGEILASSDILFIFRDLYVPLDPVSANKSDRDWIFCEKEETGMRTVLSPVKNNEFNLELNSDKEISFVWIDRVSHEIRETPGLPDVFKVRYEKEPDICPEALFHSDGESDGDSLYLRGKAPVLTVKDKEFAHVYTEIKCGNMEKTVEIKGEESFEFDEGEYEVRVWGEDGWGVKEDAGLPYNSFIYDNTPPSVPDISLSSLKTGCAGKDGYIYGNPVIVSPDAKDSLSGVDGYIFNLKNSVNGSEYEAYGDRIQINPPFYGTVTVKAVDRSGNVSDEVIIDKLILDNSKPTLDDRKIESIGEGKISILLSLSDSLSGIVSEEVSLNEKMIKSLEREGVLKDGIKIVLDEKELINGKNIIKLKCTDSVSNIAVYEFTLEKADERTGDTEKNGKKDTDKDKEKEYEPPVLLLKGFKDFQKCEGPVTIETGFLKGDDTEESIVLIEQHDEEGGLKNLFKAESGQIRVSEEGNYVVRYIVSGKDGEYEKTGYFTIDNSSPVLTSLKSIDGKSFHEFSLRSSAINDIKDYTYVDSRMTLSGRDYNGEKISEPGRYILKLTATDELGHSAEETAEFLILNDDGKDKEIKETEAEHTDKTTSTNRVSTVTVSSGKISKDRISVNTVSFNRISEKTVNLAPQNIKAEEKTIGIKSRILIVLILLIIFIPISSSVLYLMKEPGE